MSRPPHAGVTGQLAGTDNPHRSPGVQRDVTKSRWRVWLARPFRRRSWPAWLWLLAALSVIVTDSLALRVAAGLLLLGFLPGWSLLEAWFPSPTEIPWRVVLAGAMSVVLVGLGTLYLVYLSIPLTEWHVLAVCAAVTWPGVVVAQYRRPPPLVWPGWRLGLILLAVLVAAAALRLTQLGYAEFHEDEVEVVSLAARAIHGEGYAAFLHRKGPMQMLLPMAGWLLAGHVNEGSARLPFAIASLLGVLAVTWLAYKAAGRPAALTAGLMVAANGYLVAFGRMVQYQSLVFLLVSAAVLCLWQAARGDDRRLIWPAVLCVAVSLLAHFDTLVYLPVIGYLIWQTGRRWPAVRSILVPATGAAAAVCLSFYVPYLLDTQFSHTADYLLANRVGTRWLYNNLPLLWSLDATYASRLYQPLLLVLVVPAVLMHLAATARRLVWLITAIGAVGTAVAMWWPAALRFWTLSLALVPWLMLACGVVWAMRCERRGPVVGLDASPSGFESIVLWWAVPGLAYTFLVGDPRTHVYVMYPGAAVLAGIGAAVLWRRVGCARWPLTVVAGVVLTLVVAYQAIIYLPTETALAEVRPDWRRSPAALVYGDLPAPRSYFGYPGRTGWKGAGYLMATDAVPDDYRSVGIEFSVPVWYTFETPRSCYEDADLYLIAQPVDGVPTLPEALLAANYGQVATILSEGRPRLQLWQKNAPSGSPATYDLTDLAPQFDALAVPERFGRLAGDTTTVDYRFGNLARLTDFRLTPPALENGARLKPGDSFTLRLNWLSLDSTVTAYRAFVHLGEEPVWAQHDDDPACRLPMPLWRPGQAAIGQFRIEIPPTIPSGSYPIWVGLYDPTTMQRLPVVNGGGRPIGDTVHLATVEVGAAP